MRNRIVVWGRNAQEARVLIGVELLSDQNIVKVQTWEEKTVSDEVYKTFMDKWRKNEEAELPEPHKVYARELSVTESLLPDELKAEQTDMINRAQTEWHYAVLSQKMKMAYEAELAEIGDRVERAGKYDSNLWGQLKTFWTKVQQQLRDKTLLREHGNKLRKDVDGLFEQMKALRDQANEEIKEKSASAVSEFAARLEDLEKRTEEGTHLRKVFDDLRKLQSKFHNTTFSRDDRKLIYDRIDKAFKSVKAKRSGGAGGERAASNLSRTEARYEGLLKAMEKMERSIGRDKKDLEFEHRRIERTDGQLEAQIRQAKIKMIEARVASKGEKLDDMTKTKAMLEKRMAKEKKKIAKEEKRQAERAAAEAVKAKIAAEAQAAQSDMSEAEKAKLAAAAAAIQAGKKSRGKKAKTANTPTSPTDRLVANAVALSEVLNGETASKTEPTPEAAPTTEATPETTPTTVSAAAAETPKPTAETPEAPEAPSAAPEPEASLLEKAGDFLESASEKLEDAMEDAVDTAKAVAQVAGEKLSGAVEEVKEELREISGEEE